MKIKIRLVFLILFFTFSGFAQKTERDRGWNQPVEPFKLIGSVYYVGVTEITSFLIVTPRGHILIDGGFAETAPIIRANIAKLGFKLEDVKILLNTQAHYDHAAGLAELKLLSKAKMLASPLDKILLENGGKNDFAFGDDGAYQAVKVDKILADGEKIRLGGIVLKTIFTPGHTKGCTSFWLEMRENRKKYSLLFLGSTSVPGYKLVGNEKYPNIVGDYEKTFSVLRKLQPDVFVGSHGGFFDLLGKIEKIKADRSTNPFINPQEYIEFLDDSEKSFREKLNQK